MCPVVHVSPAQLAAYDVAQHVVSPQTEQGNIRAVKVTVQDAKAMQRVTYALANCALQQGRPCELLHAEWTKRASDWASQHDAGSKHALTLYKPD